MEARDKPNDAAIIESINKELHPYYQKLVNLYRPDLGDETKAGVEPCEPIFHELQPHNFPKDHLKLEPTERERDERKVEVANLLTTQLEQNENGETVEGLPSRLLLLGQPESGKTALLALLLHHWLHDRTKVKGLDDFEVLVAIQCLALESTNDGSAVDLSKDVLARLSKTVEKHGEEKVLEVLKNAKVLVLVDSLESAAVDETSLSFWKNQRIIMLCRLKFMKENIPHPLRFCQSRDHLVLRLWGGIASNRFETLKDSSEKLSDLSGGLSGKYLEDYCRRLCRVKGKKHEHFWKSLLSQLEFLPHEMRKPFNIYMQFQEYCKERKGCAKTVSELYSSWYGLQSSSYEELNTQMPDCSSLIFEATVYLSKLAYDCHDRKDDYLPSEATLKEENGKFDQIKSFFSHILVPHYNASGAVQRYTFRVAAQRTFFIAKHIVSRLSNKLNPVTELMPSADFSSFISILPMAIGIAQGNSLCDELRSHALDLAGLIMDQEFTDSFHDPIINYGIEIVGESGLFTNPNDKFIKGMLDMMKKDNWCILDGNLNPEALGALCTSSHNYETAKKISNIFFIFDGHFSEMPGLLKLIEAVRDHDIRIGLDMKRSFSGKDKKPLDEVIKALQGKGQSSLGKFNGYLKDVELLERHPATRRLYSISLRIHSHNQYESLHRIASTSNKLKRVFLRITYDSTLKIKKLKELSESITHLTVYLEGVEDETVNEGMAMWRAIRGNIERQSQERLKFWDIDGHYLTFSGATRIIEADLPARHIDISLRQPTGTNSEEAKLKQIRDIKEKLADKKYKNITVKLLGNIHYPREDL